MTAPPPPRPPKERLLDRRLVDLTVGNVLCIVFVLFVALVLFSVVAGSVGGGGGGGKRSTGTTIISPAWPTRTGP